MRHLLRYGPSSNTGTSSVFGRRRWDSGSQHSVTICHLSVTVCHPSASSPVKGTEIPPCRRTRGLDVDARRHGAGRSAHRKRFGKVELFTVRSKDKDESLPSQPNSNGRDKRLCFLTTTQRTETQTGRPETKGGKALGRENVMFSEFGRN